MCGCDSDRRGGGKTRGTKYGGQSTATRWQKFPEIPISNAVEEKHTMRTVDATRTKRFLEHDETVSQSVLPRSPNTASHKTTLSHSLATRLATNMHERNIPSPNCATECHKNPLPHVWEKSWQSVSHQLRLCRNSRPQLLPLKRDILDHPLACRKKPLDAGARGEP